MIDKTHFRLSASNNEKPIDLSLESQSDVTDSEPPTERLTDVEKRLALFEELLFDCAMTLKDKVADRLDQLEDLCHHETALLRQEFQQEDQDRKKELNLLTLKISEAIDRLATKKARQSSIAEDPSTQDKGERQLNLDGLPPTDRQSRN
jgi:hypothetical protein